MSLLWKMNRLTKTSIIIICLMAIMIALTGCGGVSQSNDKEIVVTSFGGKYDEVFMKYVAKPFEDKNPGVKVKLAPYTSITKLSQGGGQSIDVVQLDDFDIIEAANKGLLSPLQKNDFSSWDKLYPQAFLNNKDGQTFGLTNVFGAWGIAYNPEKTDKPTSWNDLWNPNVKGKVAMMSQWIPDILMTQKMTNSTLENMNPVWDAYKQITPSIAQYYNSFSAPEALFKSNEVIMASWFDGRANALKKAGTPIDFVIPKEGGILIRSGMAVLKSSSKQELTKKLIDFAMTPEAQLGFVKELYYGPTNTTVKLDDMELAKTVVYGKDKIDALTTPDWNSIFPKREEWLLKWQEATSR
jgi:putative spermidine/putrescine transport system substrate-binding protein